MGTQSQRAAYQNHRKEGKNCWCREEEKMIHQQDYLNTILLLIIFTYILFKLLVTQTI